MRNWNSTFPGRPFSAWQCLDRTYEELKRYSLIGVRSFPNVFGSYLWGIETNAAFEWYCLGRHVWIVPMRNWNPSYTAMVAFALKEFGSYLWGIETTPQELADTSGFPGLDRTYEELKLLTMKSGEWMTIGCLDRTYEELKPPFPQMIGAVFRRLDRTYEELKLHAIHRGQCAPLEFGSYLWGIETRVPVPTSPVRPAFGSYLWGIETDQPETPRCQASRVWIVPMRNWNSSGIWSWPKKLYSVWIVPMRNWNFFECRSTFFCGLVWIVPMRNWNTANSIVPITGVALVWIVPMRNWNRQKRRNHSPRRGVWIVPMRNWNSVW